VTGRPAHHRLALEVRYVRTRTLLVEQRNIDCEIVVARR
jgi:hypothetical protein